MASRGSEKRETVIKCRDKCPLLRSADAKVPDSRDCPSGGDVGRAPNCTKSAIGFEETFASDTAINVRVILDRPRPEAYSERHENTAHEVKRRYSLKYSVS